MTLKKILLSPLIILLCWQIASAQMIFINEINHLATDKGVEIGGPANSNLLGWSVVIYDENGFEDETIPLNALIPDLQNDFGFVWIEVIAGFQGPAGGAVLVNNNNQIVQFLSYGEEIKGNGGIADGIKSVLIGTQTNGDDALQLTGSGMDYTDFTWGIPGSFTPGALNNGQAIVNNPDNSALLPVTWTNFTGKAVADGIQLNWGTANEQNNDYFKIEHSTDGRHFEEIGQVMSLGDSEAERQYDFYHQKTTATKNYYRLVQVDFDGKSSASNIIQIAANNNLDGLRIYPNPMSNQVSVAVAGDNDEPLMITIYNAVGTPILTTTSNAENVITLDVENLPRGSYFIKIQGATTAFTQKIIKR